MSSENERKRKGASQPSRLHGVLRGGMAFTLASTLMLPTTALADEPSIGSGTPRSEQNVVDELLKAEQAQTASTDATSDGVAEAAGEAAGMDAASEATGEASGAADEADTEAPDPNALIGSVAAGETDENSAGGGVLLTDPIADADAEGNVTIIVQLEEGGSQGATLLSSIFGTATQDRHTYFKDKVRELATEADENGATLFSVADDPVQELHDYYHVIDGFAIKAPAAILDDIKALDGVKSAFIETLHEIPEDEASEGGVANQDSLNMTGADDVDYSGKGQLIAIIDSGLDTDHEAFSGAIPEGSATLTQDEAQGVRDGATYVSEKIPYTYDYADNDGDVNPSATASEHGTHVAGIASANGGEIRGTAPDAQIAMMKVATDSQGALPDSAILAALDDVQSIGATSVNMSFGLDAGFADGSLTATYADAFATLDAAGITLNVAAGNAYSAALGNKSGVNLPYATDPDSAMISSPAAMDEAFAVASADVTKQRPYITSGTGAQIAYEELASYSGSGATVPSFEENVENGTYNVVDGGYGTTEDAAALATEHPSQDWAKTVVMVKRGTANGSELKLGEKVVNVTAAQPDVAAVILYNNESGAMSNVATDVSVSRPALTVSKEDGEALLAEDDPTITVEHGNLMAASTDYAVSTFSSWGVTPDLKLKPEILAPGGNVYSSVLDGKYAYMSGTSMATPQMSGIAAQMHQLIDEDARFSGMTDADKADVITQLLMSTAVPAAKGDSYYSPRQQGAGMASVPAATASDVYATVEGAEDVSRPKADLGDSADGTWSFTVTLHNLGDDAHSFTLDTAALSEQVEDGLMQQSSENWKGKGISVSYSGLAGDTVTVPAKGTANVTVSITCEDAFKTWASANTPNGTFVDGFAMFKAADEGVDLSVPFMGFYGDWSKAPVFDGKLIPGDDAEEGQLTGDYHIYGTVEADPNGYALGLNTLDSDATTRFQAGDYSVVDTDKMVVSNMGFSTSPNQLVPLTGLLRNADNITYTYKNADGETVLEYSYDSVRKSYYYQSNGQITWAEAFMTDQPIFNGRNAEGEMLPDGTYTLTRTAIVAGAEDTQTDEVSFYFDTTGPVIDNVTYTGEGDGRVMSFDVTDSSFLAAVDFRVPSDNAAGYGNTIFYRINPDVDAYTDNGDGTRTWHFDVPIADVKAGWESSDQLVGGALGAFPNSVSMGCWDYGQNGSNAVNAVATPIEAASVELSATEIALAPGQMGKLTATVLPEDTTEPELAWASSDDGIVAVDEEGNLQGIAEGEATITASVKANPGVKAQATVKVANVSAGTGIIMSQDVAQVAPQETIELTAIIAPEYKGAEVEWSSSNESVASVAANSEDSTKAIVTAGENIGDATVTAKLTKEGGKIYTAETDIQVRPANYDEFEIDENGVLLYYKGNSTYVEIPNNVTEIGESAFQATPVQEVVIPQSVKKIGDYAFRQAMGLSKVTFLDTEENPSQLEEVGREVFANTSDKFTEIAFPQSLKKMGEACFASTYITKIDFGGLTEIPANAVNYASRFSTVTMSEKVTSIGDGAFASTGIGEINLSNEKGEVVGKGWPSGLATIGSGSFAGTWISDGNMPDTVTSIGDSAFALTKMTEINLNKVQHVGSVAFQGTGITELDIPDSVTSVGTGAFAQMGSLTKVHIGKNVPEASMTGLFQYSAAITEFSADEEANCSIVDGVLFSKDKTRLINYANGRAGAYEVPEGTVDIDYAAFQQGAVSGVTFPEGLKTIGGNAFSGCANLAGQIILPDSMETVDGYGFSNDLLITYVDLGGTKSIGGSSFYSCAALTDIDFGDRLESIGTLAFGLGVPLTEVIMPDTLTSIGDSAFSNNAALKKVHIGAGMTATFSMLFTGCNNIEELTVAEGNPVYSAQDNVLYGDLIYEEGATDSYGKPMYSGKHLVLALPTSQAAELEIAEGTEYVDAQAVRNLSKLQKVVLPASIKGLYTGAFNGCNALTEVVFEGEGPQFVHGNAFPASNVEVIDFGSRIESIDGAFMMGAPKHLVIRGGNNGTYSEGLNIGGKSETVYTGSGMATVSIGGASLVVVGPDVTSLTLPQVSSPNDIAVYATPGTTGYETAKAALANIGVADTYLKDYAELSVALEGDAATTPGATVTATATAQGGVEGDVSYRFIQVGSDGAETVLSDWSNASSVEWKVPSDGATLRAEVRDATYLTADATLGAIEAPVITGDLPSEPIVSVGGDKTLAVIAQAEEGAQLTYQWYMDGTAIEGATDASFTPTESGKHAYYVMVTATKDGASASVKSGIATVTAYAKASAPVINSALVSATVEQGSKVALSIDAESADGGTLTYQWYKDGAAIEGATTSVYAVDTNEVGEHTYSVEVTNTLGVASNAAAVTGGEATITVVEGTPAPQPGEVDTTGLVNAIASANAIEQGNKSDEAWDALRAAIASALDVLGNVEATQDDVNAAIDALNAAVDEFNASEDVEPAPEPDPDPAPTPNPDDQGGQGVNSSDQGGADSNNGGQNGSGKGGTLSKTGDVAPVAAVSVIGGISAAVAAAALFIRRKFNMR